MSDQFRSGAVAVGEFFGRNVHFLGHRQQQIAEMCLRVHGVMTDGIMLGVIVEIVGVSLGFGFRVEIESEISGVDLSEHAESAYEMGGILKGGR